MISNPEKYTCGIFTLVLASNQGNVFFPLLYDISWEHSCCHWTRVWCTMFLCLTQCWYVCLYFLSVSNQLSVHLHDDVIKWRHFLRYWPFVQGIHWSPVNSPHKGQWCGALMFSLICAWMNSWVNNLGTGDLRRNRAHYDVIVMCLSVSVSIYVCVSLTLK